MIQLQNFDFELEFPSGVEICVLHAHPDDEAFLNAGIIQKFVKTGRKVRVLYTAAMPQIRFPRTLQRAWEAYRATRALGVAKMNFLPNVDLPYRKDNGFALEFLTEYFLLKFWNPNRKLVLFSYDEQGGYGHPDHINVHQLAKAIQAHTNCALWESTINRDLVSRWLEVESKQPEPSLPNRRYWIRDFGLEESQISHFYPLTRQEIERKREALAMHKSQTDPKQFPLALTDTDFSHLFGIEYLRKC